MKLSVDTECSFCHCTGLCDAIFKPKDTAIICPSCKGTGCRTIIITPFKRRRAKKNIKTVANCIGNSISYQEFQEGKMP